MSLSELPTYLYTFFISPVLIIQSPIVPLSASTCAPFKVAPVMVPVAVISCANKSFRFILSAVIVPVAILFAVIVPTAISFAVIVPAAICEALILPVVILPPLIVVVFGV